MANQPTGIEFHLSDTDSTVTRTDLKGIITYACPDFIRTSGYSADDVVGRSHNIVHHPDMPDVVFKDMWNCLNQQRPWVGIVKNLRKDGSHYWAVANIVPDYEDGKHIGYMAVRKKATTEQIAHAQDAYQKINQGKGKHIRIERGEIIRPDLLQRLDFLKNASIKSRIISVIALVLFSVTLIAIGGMNGLRENNTSIESIFKDRVLPMYQISSIQRLLLNNRLLVTAALSDSTLIEKNTTQVESNIEEISRYWKNYVQTSLTPEEKVLAEQFAKDRSDFVKEGLNPVVNALRSNELEKAKNLIETQVRTRYPIVAQGIDDLLKLQMNVSQQLYDDSQTRYHQLLSLIGITSAGLAFLILIMGNSLYRAIVRPLRTTADLIIRGDNKNWLDVREGSQEIVDVLNSFKTSQVKSSFNEAEAKREADANLRVRIGLDSVTTGVMIANADRKIIYVNRAVRDLLAGAQDDIRKQLPHFSVEHLIGSNIDIYHKDPQHQRNVLQEARQQITAKLEIGQRKLVVIASPVINDKGEIIGTIAEWKDRTSEIAVENRISKVIDAIGQGDFSMRVDEKGKKEFILSVSCGINRLVETCSESLNDMVRVLNALSHGDLTQTIDKNYLGIFGSLKDDTNATVENLKSIVKQIKEITDNVNVGAKEIAAGNNDLSQRTERQAASLEGTAASMAQLTSTVKNNADNAKEANQLALDSSNIAQRGMSVISEVVKTMDDISQSSRKIGDIISVIDDIAFQTNILALNAAVEAARAGEQGKGFAVVAVEVRNLAQRASSAANEIKTLIDDSLTKVVSGTKQVSNAGSTMQDIVHSIRGVTDMMSQITTASAEQSEGIEQVNKAVTQMDEVTQQNAALVEQSAAAAEALEDQARTLTTTVGHFKIDERGARKTPSPTPSASSAKKAPAKTASVKASVPSAPAIGDDWEEF